MAVSGTNGWPAARQGPEILYKHDDASNPVLRGFILVAANFLVQTFAFVRSILWKLNGFDKLKDIPSLSEYEACYDPCVVGLHPSDGVITAIADLPAPTPRKTKATYWTAGDYHRAYISGTVTPTDVAKKLLPLISRNQPSPSHYSIAFLEVQSSIILASAAASTARYKNKSPLSALDGVPIAVKDEIDLANYTRSLGSRADFTNPAHQTGWCVSQWETAGALIIGKTNMHEIGMDTNGNNPYHGTPLNPHNSSYYCGGSSSGSAMAVASGLCPIAHGADGGGSIRLPASFCGIYGLKPTHGRVSGRPSTDVCSSVGVHGPMASDLESLVLAYRVMAQPDPEHKSSRAFPNPLRLPATSPSPSSIPKSLPPPRRKLLGLYNPWIETSHPSVLSLFNAAITHYTTLPDPYTIIPITLPHITSQQLAHSLTITSECTAGLTPQQTSLLNPANQLVLSVVAGPQCHAQHFIAAQKLRSMMMEHLSYLWKEHGEDMLIVTPTTPCAGWEIGNGGKDAMTAGEGGRGVSDGDKTVESMRFVFLANWSGCPAITRPMGFVRGTGDDGDDEGKVKGGSVPVGIMAMGAWGSEEKLFEWARDGEGLMAEGSATIPRRKDGWFDVLDL